MADLANRLDRRRGSRVTMRGTAVFYGEDGATCGTIENVSRGGALIRFVGAHDGVADPAARLLDVELELGNESAWARARTVRVIRVGAGAWRIAVAFEHVDDTLGVAIDRALAAAIRRCATRKVKPTARAPRRAAARLPAAKQLRHR